MLSVANFEDEQEETSDFRLPGMYNLALPVSIFQMLAFIPFILDQKKLKQRY